jgi:nucleoside-diphosphate-sugar epimerase
MNIGNPREFMVLELAELIRDLTGSSSPITFVARPQDDPTVRQPDITFARTALSWEPAVDVKDGLLRTIEWFRQHKDLKELSSAGAGHLER